MPWLRRRSRCSRMAPDMPDTPFTRRVLNAVIPPMARWLVGQMRRLEEVVPDATARWEILRQRLEGIGRDRP